MTARVATADDLADAPWPDHADEPARLPVHALDDFALAPVDRDSVAGDRPVPRPRSEADPSLALADEWQIDGLLRPARLLVIAAAESTGKSHVRIEMAIRLSTGHGALFNHYRIPERCRVVSFDVENGEEEETRREEMALATLGLDRSALTDYYGVSLEGLSLGNAEDQTYIRAAIERILPAVAFFDTGSSMVGDEWGTELKGAIRFLRGLAREYGCSVVVFVHLVKPAKAVGGKGKGRPEAQHGTALADVMGQWTRQADTVAMMADAGADRRLWTVRKRAPHSQLVLRIVDGTFDAVQVTAGEDLGVSTMERIHGVIATGQGDAASIATYLDINERTVWRHVAKLREAGRIEPDAPLRVSVGLSGPVSRPVSAPPRTNRAAVSPAVSDMSVERTDMSVPPKGGDSVSVSQSGDSPATVRCTSYRAHRSDHVRVGDGFVCRICGPSLDGVA